MVHYVTYQAYLIWSAMYRGRGEAIRGHPRIKPLVGGLWGAVWCTESHPEVIIYTLGHMTRDDPRLFSLSLVPIF